MFAFQSDRNMAERFPFGTASAIHVNLETVGPSAEGAGKSLLGAPPRELPFELCRRVSKEGLHIRLATSKI